MEVACSPSQVNPLPKPGLRQLIRVFCFSDHRIGKRRSFTIGCHALVHSFLGSHQPECAGATPPASFRQCLHIGRREDTWSPAEMCWCCSGQGTISMQRARSAMPSRQTGAVSTDEMKLPTKLQQMRSSVAEHRPHKAACTGSSPVASTSFAE